MEAGGLDVTPIGPWPEAHGWLEPIDEEVLGFRRETHHAFLLGSFAAHGLRIERAGRPVGYAYVSTRRAISGRLPSRPAPTPARW